MPYLATISSWPVDRVCRRYRKTQMPLAKSPVQSVDALRPPRQRRPGRWGTADRHGRCRIATSSCRNKRRILDQYESGRSRSSRIRRRRRSGRRTGFSISVSVARWYSGCGFDVAWVWRPNCELSVFLHLVRGGYQANLQMMKSRVERVLDSRRICGLCWYIGGRMASLHHISFGGFWR